MPQFLESFCCLLFKLFIDSLSFNNTFLLRLMPSAIYKLYELLKIYTRFVANLLAGTQFAGLRILDGLDILRNRVSHEPVPVNDRQTVSLLISFNESLLCAEQYWTLLIVYIFKVPNCILL